MPRLTCECGRILRYEPRHYGKKIRCPGCEVILRVPDAQEADEEIESVLPVEPAEKPRPPRLPSAVSADEDEKPRKRPSRLRDESDDEPVERPKKRRRSSAAPSRSRFGEMLWSSGGGWTITLLIVFGGIGLFIGGREMMLARGATSQASSIRLADLIAKGNGGNTHVEVTDFTPGQNFLYKVKVTRTEQRLGNTGGKPWSAVYVPLLPSTTNQVAALGMPNRFGLRNPGGIGASASGPIQALFISYKAKNQGEMEQCFAGGKVRGTIITSVTSIDSEIRDRLAQNYPGTDFSRVVLIEDREPWSTGLSLAMLIGAGLLLAAGLFLGFIALMNRP